jgi:hypothetical protein
MTQQYAQLTYKGDVTSSPNAQPGRLLGMDEAGRYYEVIDAEFIGPPVFEGCMDHDIGPHTHVNIQWASPEAIKAELTLLEAAMERSQR